MRTEHGQPLSSLTTMKVGGVASIVVTLESPEELPAALALATEEGLPWKVLGGGSNVVFPDAGFAGVLIRLPEGEVAEEGEGRERTLVASAGYSWDALVADSVARGLWGLENLAGIPGTVGATPIQNVGAYGIEIADVLAWVEVYDTESGTSMRMRASDCEFGYRDSIFKRERTRIITRVAFSLSTNPLPNLGYRDLATYFADAHSEPTLAAIREAVLLIRRSKFPDLRAVGTAGSFFKNPIIDCREAGALRERYPELPVYPVGERCKVSLAWILDHVCGLRGYTVGSVGLYERQPLVVVAHEGATASDLDKLAADVAERVNDATGITIEREVEIVYA